jgi:hypothetical protein
MRNICFGLLMIFITACSTQEEVETVYDVPEEFQTIVETFIEEAALRGFNYQITNLIIRYDDDPESNYCGLCNSSSIDQNIQKIILINSSKCWLNDAQKEALIFHELGHCFLGRLHDTTLLPNDDPKSMMAEGNIRIYSPCIYAIGGTNDCNFTFKRTYYLDELFNENAPTPDWAQ